MATTKAMASSLILLLATFLLAAATVQARYESLPPPPAEAPAPVPSAGGGGQCTPEGVAELKVCVGLQVDVLGRTNTAARDLCCELIREKPIAEAVKCLCTVFWPSNARDPVEVADDVNAVLAVCGEPRIPDPVCVL